VTRLFLRSATLLDPELGVLVGAGLLIEGERIADVLRAGERPPDDARIVDLGPASIAPGFIDLHYHGELPFAPEADALDALARASASLSRHGTTAFLPTTLAWPSDRLAGFVTRFEASMTQRRFDGASPLGLHLEGPWISPAAAGAQPRSGIRPFDLREGRELLQRGRGLIRMVTLAPEVEGAPLLLDELASRGVIASLGHSAAAAPQIERAIEGGLRHVTHLFNAMTQIHHRELGVAGVALCDDRLTCDLICDGVHVHPGLVVAASRAKGESLMLITDRVEIPRDGGSFAGSELHDDGRAIRQADGRLAGSSLGLDAAVANAVRFGAMSRLEAVAAATLRPSRLLAMEHERGTLRQGARADLVVLDAELAVRQTWLGGRRVYTAEPAVGAGG
jgi:N-acetylglucosamine-6-phosphate deacetylase